MTKLKCFYREVFPKSELKEVYYFFAWIDEKLAFEGSWISHLHHVMIKDRVLMKEMNEK